ncbi:MAG: amidase, partial [Acetobacteraceae bacterium]
VLIGKTNVPEFTSQGYTDNAVFGPTRNPWNTGLTPGGSSGGAVAAVAAGIGPFAIGTDGGGSIRRPASHAGVFGLKPSLGRVARCDGLPAILLDYEVIGPIARTVGDLVTVMRVIGRPDPRDPASMSLPDFAIPSPGPCRIRYVPRFGTHPVDPEIAASTDAVARALAGLGHQVETGEAPFDVDAVARIQATVGQAGLAWLEQDFGVAPVADGLKQAAALGAGMNAATLFAALDAASALRRRLGVFFASHDLILTPAAAALPWPAPETHPPEIDGRTVGPRGHAVFTAFANIAGLPGVAVPGPPSAGGLPIGVQLVGKLGADGLLLAVAEQVARAHPEYTGWPDLD